MNDLPDGVAAAMDSIDHACAQACAAIAPAWPLDRAIAVNPHWQRIGQPLREVAARMAVLGNVRVFPARPYIQQAWNQGRVTAQDLALALSELAPPGLDVAQCIEALRHQPAITPLPLLIDVLDDDPGRTARLSWRQAITHQVSQTCAAYFDERQADWQPERGDGLYGFWRDTLTHDHGIGTLMGLAGLGQRLHALPATRQDAERWALERLALPPAAWADYLEAVLLTVNGWASWCAYLGWQARQEGRSDEHLRDLLAIRLAWGAVLLECKTDASAKRAFTALQAAWACATQALTAAGDALRVDEVWQRALEVGYQRDLAKRLSVAKVPPDLLQSAASASVPRVQAVFCIDVRSERIRRSIEAVWPEVQTLGFAGFFGLPIAYTPMGTAARRPQLPGLLAPAMEVTDVMAVSAGAGDAAQTAEAERARQRRLAWAEQWQAGSRWPNAAFSFVEAAGASYVARLAGWLMPGKEARARDDLAGLPARYRPVCRPALTGLDMSAKVQLAARVLHALGLERHFAPLVLLVGHGSQSANNAHAAALDCGACCGQTGEVNARALAGLLNEPEVRSALAEQSVLIPADTVFAAALHNTTTDELEWFDTDLLPAHVHADWTQLQQAFAHASDQVRRERAPHLGLDPRTEHHTLLRQLRRRANDGAQTRPEWGLAGNAAFIIAPRARTRGVMLDGRSFLHDYDAAADVDGSVLELLMTAPMLVTHWINWQYHASTCEPQRLGSGNKVLHNVVGGTLGVFEGNGGDLRIGLSLQSVHDGARWMHEPLRLTVAIDAPPQVIERVIGRHEVVRQLLDNGWLHLWCLHGDGIAQYRAGQWDALAPGPA